MFTGIIKIRGTIKKIYTHDSIGHISIYCTGLHAKLGDSVAINGVCLTVSKYKGNVYEFDIVAETLKRTTLKNLAEGAKVNLERSLRLGEGIDGHFVLGHIDGVGIIKKLVTRDQNLTVSIAFPKSLKKYIAEKGSITIDGVSLTVIDAGKDFFTVTIVPHTLQKTIVHYYICGQKVNLEVDVIARYVYNSTR